MNILIELALIQDAENLVELYRDAYSENDKIGLPASASKATVKEVEKWIEDTILFIARDTEITEVIGTIRFKYNPDWGCYVLSRLAVKSSYKGKGLGKKLILFGEDYLKKMNEKMVRLTVAKPHPYLVNMYEKLGYKIRGERILENLPYDEFIMEKVLNETKE